MASTDVELCSSIFLPYPYNQAMRLPTQNKAVFMAHEWYAAVAVQSAWRGRSLRTKLSTRQFSSEVSKSKVDIPKTHTHSNAFPF